MKCSGVVASVEGSRAKVVIGHKEGCSGCGKCGRFRNMTINAQNDIGAAAGDKVLLDISDKKFIFPCCFYMFYRWSACVQELSVDIWERRLWI